MSHLHIPDGIISIVWAAVGYLATALILFMCAYRLKGQQTRKTPLIGIFAAVMLLTMGVFPYHLNLAVLSGIILGPWLGFIAVFIVNLLLSLMGHGGITVVGLNTLILGSEVVLGYILFRLLKGFIKPMAAAGITAIVSLAVSLVFMFSVVSLVNIDPVAALSHGHIHNDHGEIHQIVEDNDSHIYNGQKQENNAKDHGQSVQGTSAHNSGPDDRQVGGGVSLRRFIMFSLPVAMPGIIIEIIATILIVGFIMKVRPKALP
jgi:cobalt/nickel transport system permease protein